jgi:hypothetical protein
VNRIVPQGQKRDALVACLMEWTTSNGRNENITDTPVRQSKKQGPNSKQKSSGVKTRGRNREENVEREGQGESRGHICKRNRKRRGPVRKFSKKFGPFLDLCVSSLRRGHANLLCIVPILSDVSEETTRLERSGL